MHQYHELLKQVLHNGTEKQDRTGTGTYSLFGYQMRFNLADGFPLLTTKRVHWKSVVHELLCFLRGEANIQYLNEHGVKIWDEWADDEGNLGPVYGVQWRKWKTFTEQSNGTVSEGTIDQIAQVIETIRKDPDSRRMIVSAWNVSDLAKMALPPCHTLFQFYVVNQKLSCQLYQRSADIFLGVPFNIASYALLTHMVAQVCDLQVGDFVHTIGDAHLYKNHVEQARIQLGRAPHALPTVELNPDIKDIDLFTYQDIQLLNYTPWPGIKAEVSV